MAGPLRPRLNSRATPKAAGAGLVLALILASMASPLPAHGQTPQLQTLTQQNAAALVGESVAQPLRYFRNNVGGTLSLLDRVAAGGASRFVFSSSAAVYGEPPGTPITEDFPLCEGCQCFFNNKCLVDPYTSLSVEECYVASPLVRKGESDG